VKELVTITTIDNFSDKKAEVLKAIASAQHNPRNSTTEKICETDWDVYTEGPKPYILPILSDIETHLLTLSKRFKYRSMQTVDNGIWFQRYERGGYHGMHLHGACTFSSVVYIELPDDQSGTTFNVLGEEFVVDISEGDIITFPSFMPHRSNPSSGVKTVIAFNSNADGYDDD